MLQTTRLFLNESRQGCGTKKNKTWKIEQKQCEKEQKRTLRNPA
jgi:hypothetical protein